MRLRMFLSFASWRRRTKISTMLMQAIIRTLVDKITLILANIQRALPLKDDGSSLLSQDQIRVAIKSTKSEKTQIAAATVSETIPEDVISLLVELDRQKSNLAFVVGKIQSQDWKFQKHLGITNMTSAKQTQLNLFSNFFLKHSLTRKLS